MLSGHIQIAQVPYRHEPDEQGEINYPFVFQTLRSLGYRGWIGCEYVPRGGFVCCSSLGELSKLYSSLCFVSRLSGVTVFFR